MLANGFSPDPSLDANTLLKTSDLEESPSPIVTEEPIEPTPSETLLPSPKSRRLNLKALSLRTKATALAIAIGTVPLVAIGTAAYFATSQIIDTKIINYQEGEAVTSADRVNRFMFERYGDIQTLANLPILRNNKVKEVVPLNERAEVLNRFMASYGVYDSIGVFDLNGNVVIQTSGEPLGNHRDFDYFQQAVRTGTPVISQPEIAKATGEVSVRFAAPIRDSVTGQMIGVVRTRMPIKYIQDLLDQSQRDELDIHVLDLTNRVILAHNAEQIGRDGWNDFPALLPFKNTNTVTSKITIEELSKKEQIATVAPITQYRDMPSLGWNIILSVDTQKAFAAKQQLLLTLSIGTAVAGVTIASIAAVLAYRATKPIQDAAIAVEKIGQGELDTRLTVTGEDEVAILSTNINLMAIQIGALVDEQKAETERIELARQEARMEADASAQEQRQQKEFLQKRALELLMEVDPVSKGDLTVRANVTPDEVGTIADSYNAIIRSLRQIVGQVQDASESVSLTASNNEAAVSGLSLEARNQMQAILLASDKIQSMVESIAGVAERAQQAKLSVLKANETIQAGDEAMNQTVQGISAIRETVSETAKKVKRLGEASQKISKVINLISGFASQTNLLALNAAIEAARAGEEGRGFAVVAEEVRSLAQQSAAATAEIEQLVEEIQAQTNDVVTAMEEGTEQVVTGTQLVQKTRQRLNQITAVSTQISELVQEISQATAVQTEASLTVNETIQQIAVIADETSQRSDSVAQSFTNLLQVAKELQVSVAQFKVS